MTRTKKNRFNRFFLECFKFWNHFFSSVYCFSSWVLTFVQNKCTVIKVTSLWAKKRVIEFLWMCKVGLSFSENHQTSEAIKLYKKRGTATNSWEITKKWVAFLLWLLSSLWRHFVSEMCSCSHEKKIKRERIDERFNNRKISPFATHIQHKTCILTKRDSSVPTLFEHSPLWLVVPFTHREPIICTHMYIHI